MPTQQKAYPKEFKEEAVRLAQQQCKTTETAHNLGVPISVLRWWIKEKKTVKKPFRGKDIVLMKNYANCKRKING